MSGSEGYTGQTTTLMLYQADNVTQGMYNMADYMTISLRANDLILL